MPNNRVVYFLCIAATCLAIVTIPSCRKAQPFDSDLNEWFSGGKQTIFGQSSGAFSNIFPSISALRDMDHEIGDKAFEATFVSAPAPKMPGLGPLFNSVSCTSCHVADGRGKPPLTPTEGLTSLLIRISIPGMDAHGGPLAVPGFGGQLQQKAIAGVLPEANVSVSYETMEKQFADGTSYVLNKPSYHISNSYIPLPSDVLVSPRVAPPVFGLGLLQAINEQDIVMNADEFDSNNDGISGKANYVWSYELNKKMLGRFGWKAASPSVIEQSAGAYNQDMGITSFIFPLESSFEQLQDDKLNDGKEVSDSLLYAVDIYIRTLAVPGRRNADDVNVIKGKQLFVQAKCVNCHTPSFETGVHVNFAEVSSQKIYPYSDLLLHDMGAGLADNRPDYLANGNEWRTSPLWGIGLTNAVNGHSNFLHDGRAKNLMEAIMWHGGEAEVSRKAVENFSKEQRNLLLLFLESL